MKKRILLVSEFSQLATGFSVMADGILKDLYKSEKYEIAELSSYISEDDPSINEVPWKVYPVIPSRSNPDAFQEYEQSKGGLAQFGMDKFEEVVLDFKPDIVFSYRDWWHDEWILKSPYKRLFKYIWSACVDSEPPDIKWLEIYSKTDYLTSYTQWGLSVLRRYSGNSLNVLDIDTMPGIDTDVFKPMDKKESRAKLSLKPDINIVLTVMRNQPRKLFPDLIRSFANFIDLQYKNGKKDIADNTYLYLHTSNEDVGFDINKEILRYQMGHKVLLTYKCHKCQKIFSCFLRGNLCNCIHCGDLSARTVNTGSGATREELALIYNISDLYVQHSIAGALEIPLIEAKACGIPTIATDYAGPYELNRMGGSFGKIKLIGFKQEGIRETGQLRGIPDNDELVKLLDKYFRLSKSDKLKLSKDARETAEKYHSYHLTSEKWMKIFDKIDVLDKDRWGQEPSYIEINAEKIPEQLSDAQFVKYCVNNFLPKEHPMYTFTGEKDMLKLLSQGFEIENGEVINFDRNRVLEKINTITSRFNHYESHRHNMLVLKKKEKQTDIEYIVL